MVSLCAFFRSQVKPQLHLHSSLPVTCRPHFCSVANFFNITFQNLIRLHTPSTLPLRSILIYLTNLQVLPFFFIIYFISLQATLRAASFIYCLHSISVLTFPLHYTSPSFKPHFHQLLLYITFTLKLVSYSPSSAIYDTLSTTKITPIAASDSFSVLLSLQFSSAILPSFLNLPLFPVYFLESTSSSSSLDRSLTLYYQTPSHMPLASSSARRFLTDSSTQRWHGL